MTLRGFGRTSSFHSIGFIHNSMTLRGFGRTSSFHSIGFIQKQWQPSKTQYHNIWIMNATSVSLSTMVSGLGHFSTPIPQTVASHRKYFSFDSFTKSVSPLPIPTIRILALTATSATNCSVLAT